MHKIIHLFAYLFDFNYCSTGVAHVQLAVVIPTSSFDHPLHPPHRCMLGNESGDDWVPSALNRLEQVSHSDSDVIKRSSCVVMVSSGCHACVPSMGYCHWTPADVSVTIQSELTFPKGKPGQESAASGCTHCRWLPGAIWKDCVYVLEICVYVLWI